MKKRKILLALLTVMFTLTMGLFAFAGCNIGGNAGNTGNGGNVNDEGNTNVGGNTGTPDDGDDEEDLGDIVPPLGETACTHDNVTHKQYKAAECTVNGNYEYWYCADCKKYYSDSALTQETNLAAVTIIASHNYGELVPETTDKCVSNTAAHYYCDVCETYFTEDKVETTEDALYIAPVHDLEHVPEQEPDCYGGYGEYWECNDCHKYFGDVNGSHRLDDDLFGVYIDPVHNNGNALTHFEAHDATCIAEGNYEYWYCPVCEVYFDDEDGECEIEDIDEYTIEIDTDAHGTVTKTDAHAATCIAEGNVEYWTCALCQKNYEEQACTNELLTTVEAINPEAHDYGEFEYDYTAMKYVKTCKLSGEHTEEKAAGTEADPYLAKDDTTLKAALVNGGYIKLTESFTVTVKAVSKTVTIDLNSYTLTSASNTQALLYLKKDTGAVVTVKNGTLYNNGNNYVASGATSVSMTYAIYSQASTSAEVAPKLFLSNVTIDNNNFNAAGTTEYKEATGGSRKCSTMYAGEYAQATLENCVINGGCYGFNYKANSQITMTDCEINGAFSPLQGNGAQHGTTVNLTNTDITSYYGIYHPQDGVMNITGGTIDCVGTAIEIRAGVVTITGATLKSSYVFNAIVGSASNSSNSTSGCAVAVSQHSTDKRITVVIDGCTLEADYALYERDLINKTARDVISVDLKANNTLNGCVYSENCANIENTADANGKAYKYINSVADWVAFAAAHSEATTAVSDDHYVVTCDLDFSDTTERVDVVCFSGTVDFKNHSVSGVTLENTTYRYVSSLTTGLFVLLNNATIKNLDYEIPYFGTPGATARPALFAWRGENVLENVTVTGSVTYAENNASAFVYFVLTSADYYVNDINAEAVPIKLSFINCVNKANITNTGASATSGYVAAFLGRVVSNTAGNTVEFINCVNEGTITGYHYAAMLIANPYDNLNTLANFVVENCVNKGNIYAGIKDGATLVMAGTSKDANAFNTNYADGIANAESGTTAALVVETLEIDENKNYVIKEVAGATKYMLTFTFWCKGEDKNGNEQHGTTNTAVVVELTDKVKALEFINKTEADEKGIEYSTNEFKLYETADGANYVFMYDTTEYAYLNIDKQPTVYLTAYNAEGEVVGVATHYAN